MRWHIEVLRPSQRDLLTGFGPAMGRLRFYLAGGTAIALHLGHRRSVDLDWFSGERLGDVMRLAKVLNEEMRFRTDEVAPGTLHGNASGVRLSFIEYLYPLLHRPLTVPKFGCGVASLDDLACMKLSAVAQRGSKKDFVDIYALLVKHRPLVDLLKLYVEKYRVSDISHVLYGLAYFDDAERERMPSMLWKVKWDEVRDVIDKSVKGAVRDL